MQDNEKILNALYQSAKIGLDTINAVVNKSEDSEFSKELSYQRQIFKELGTEAVERLAMNGIEPDLNPLNSLSVWLGVNMNTLANKKTSHLAQIMIEGYNMGIIGIQKELNNAYDVDQNVVNLAHKTVTFEQNTIDQLKKYL